MLGKKGTIALTVALLIIFSGMTYVTIFQSKVSLSTSTGYLKVASATNQKPEISLKAPGCIDFNITIKTSATSLYIFSFGNVTIGTGSSGNITTNLTSFENTSSTYNSLTVNSTDRYNYVTVTDFKNNTTINLKLRVSQEAFNHMQTFNPEDKGTIYIVKLLVIGSNNGADGTGFALVKL